MNKVRVECEKCKKDMSIGELGSSEHISSCLKPLVGCPLKCEKILDSIEIGVEHLSY